MPIAFVLMTNKSFLVYEKVFANIILLLKNYKIEIDFKKIRILCDFEKSLLKAIKENFPESKLNGCYFHFIKSLWKKARSFGLTNKKLLKNTKIIIFACKIYPFILKENKKKYIAEIYQYATNIDNKYNKFIEYFKNSLEYSEFLDFEQLSNGEIINRTNNIVECFNHKLNSIVEYPHPRLSC